MLNNEQRIKKAEWIHSRYVDAWDSQNIPLGGALNDKQQAFLKKEFNRIDSEANKIFGE